MLTTDQAEADRAELSAAARLQGHLAALQLGDSAFPSGRYTFSHGLETLAQGGAFGGADRMSRMLTLVVDLVRFGVAPSDAAALGCAHRGVVDGQIDLATVRAADERLTAVKIPREARNGSTRSGRALLRTATAAFAFDCVRPYAELVGSGRAPGNHAVVLGVLSAALGVPRLEAIAGDLHSFALGLVSAATRLALIDHRQAQALLFRVHPAIVAAAEDADSRTVTHIGGCTPLLDAMSMRHEQAEVRLFAT